MTHKQSINPTQELGISHEGVAHAIADFAQNLANAFEMKDRQNAVLWLGKRIGKNSAREVAKAFGLLDSYYLRGVEV